MSHQVIIIGAGLAGLGAAEVLLEAGVVPLVLEAADQPGGRVRTLRGFAGFPIELGAEEVHGTENSIYDLIEKIGLEVIRHVSADDHLRLDGRLFSLTEASMDADVGQALKVVRDIGDYTGANWTVEEYLRRSHFPRRSQHYLDSRLGVENGTTLDRLAMQGFAGYERGWENREWNFTLREGYDRIFQSLVEKLGNQLRLNTPVATVDWRGIPQVHLADGGLLTAPKVLITASVAALRSEVMTFDPPLPPERQSALQAIGMDGGMKVILSFQERFWDERMYFLHTDGFLPQFWVPGKGKSVEPVLTAFLGGARYEWLREQKVDPVLFALGELDQIFGPSAASSRFVDGHVADWGTDPWVRGLYSYPTTATNGEVRRELGRPLEGKLFFAGEATDTAGHSGTVHGALDSGRRAAREILGL